jgi:hypothetical protein
MNIQTNLNFDGSNQTDVRSASLNSVGLELFRLNPFRVLRLPVTATSKQAIWQAGHLISLSRMNLPFQEPDLLPWLPCNSEMEIKQAAQKMEEPQQRIAEQLFWFDIARDPQGALLSEGLLKTQPQKLWKFLQIRDLELSLESISTAEKKGAVSEKLPTVFSYCIDQANLRILLALSAFYGIGPQMNDKKFFPNKSNEKSCTSVTFCWEKDSYSPSVMNPHELLSSIDDNVQIVSVWKELWIEALDGWSKVINNPLFPFYLKHLFYELGEEMLDEGVADLIYHVVSTRLSDILSGEIKNALNEGESLNLSILVDIVAKARFRQNIWNTSFTNLCYFFQSELSELNCLIENEALVTPEDIQLYFNRLRGVNRKWKGIDPQNMIGLLKLVDDAVLKGFGAITALKPFKYHLKAMESLLEAAAENAHSKSLKEKIDSYRSQVNPLCQHELCRFCKKRNSDPKFPLIIKGKKEIGEKDYLILKRIRYNIRWIILPRCEICADFHQFITNIPFCFCLVFIFSVFMLFGGLRIILRTGPFLLRIAAMLVSIVLGFKYFLSTNKNIMAGDLNISGIDLHGLQGKVLAFLSIPIHLTPFYKIKEMESYRELFSSGYDVQGIYLSKNAFKYAPKKVRSDRGIK